MRLEMILRHVTASWRRRRDERTATWASSEDPPELTTHFRMPPVEALRPDAALWAGIARDALDHRFDLLGSGPVVVRHGLEAPGFEGLRFTPDTRPGPRLRPAHRAMAERLRDLISDGYEPIDWQIDFRSGYRWREDVWVRHVPVRPARGADVKLPWELGRCQHLPQLAVAHALARAGAEGFEAARRYVREVRDRILDFKAANPPRFGVQWRCAMDVAIRLVNWLLARDLLLSGGATLDDTFERELAASALDHGRFIRQHLEWSPRFNGNHYLANLVGLAFAASYLPESPETVQWARLAATEIGTMIDSRPGRYLSPREAAIREGSTGYHRLSTEIILWWAALARRRAGRRRTRESWDESLEKRLHDAATLILWITKPDGRVPQIGDHDAGRFVTLDPRRDEDPLDHRGLVAAVGLFTASPALVKAADRVTDTGGLDALEDASVPEHAPAEAVRLAGAAGLILGQATSEATRGARPIRPRPGASPERSPEAWFEIGERMRRCGPGRHRTLRIRAPGGDLRAGLRSIPMPELGLFVMRSDRVYLSLRCDVAGDGSRSGHGHNDQLALELMVDGVDRIAERGTYLYTPLPERRNAYRSVRAHFAPRLADGREPARIDQGLFRVGSDCATAVDHCGEHGVAGHHDGFGAPIFRRVWLEEDVIVVEDAYEGDEPLAPVLPGDPGEADLDELAGWTDLPRSPAYGRLAR